MSDSSLRPMRPIKRFPFVEEVLPVHGTHEAHRVPHDPVHPCAGYGLDNPANARQYIHGFKQLQKEWPHLTPGERKMRLQNLSHQQLKKSGVPGIPIVPLPMHGANYAETVFNPWVIHVPERVLNEPHLPDATAKEFAGALYHESRHAEQAYLVMRRQAGIVAAQSHGKLTLEQQVIQINNQLGRGNEAFCDPSVVREAQKQPLHKGDAQEHCAQMMYDTFVGKHAQHADKAESLDALQHQADIANKRYAQVTQEKEAATNKRLRTEKEMLKQGAANEQWQKEQIRHLPPGPLTPERIDRINQIYQTNTPAYLRGEAADQQAIEEEGSEEAKLQRAYTYASKEDKLLAKSNTVYRNLPSEADAWDCGNTVTALWDEH